MRDIHLIKGKDINIAFHILSSQFFKVSEELFEKLKDCKEPLGYLKVEDEKLKAAIDLLDSQISLETILPKCKQRLDKVTFISVQECNLRCRYCFLGANNNATKGKVMPVEVYKDALQFMLKRFCQGIKSITFFGGEPLLAFKEISSFVEYCTEVFEEKGLNIPYFNVITNGTCFTSDSIKFFNKYKVAVTISIDGPKEINDVVRVSPSIDSVYDKILQNIEYVNKNREFLLGAEITLNRQHIKEYSKGKASTWINEISRMGFDYITVGNVETSDMQLGILDDEMLIYKDICNEIYDNLFEKMCSDNFIMSSDILRAISILKSRRIEPISCGAAVNVLTIMPDGQIQPCHVLPEDSKYGMGSIYDEDSQLFESIKDEFMDHLNNKPEDCRECWMRNICKAWCRGFGHIVNGDIFTISKLRCMMANILFENVIINITDAQRTEGKLKKLKKNIHSMKCMR